MKKTKYYIMGLLLFLFQISCSPPNFTKPVHALCENLTEIRSCPKIKGEIFLPRNYPARAIYVGYADDEVHQEFMELLIEQVKELEFRPMINVLIPRIDDDFAFDSLSKYIGQKDYNFLNFITTSSDETVWAQDYLEILFDPSKGTSKIVDLPYAGREGENIPFSIGLSCQKSVVPQMEYSEKDVPGNGDYGGNIEALTSKVIMVGNNLSEKTYEIIQSLTPQTIVDVDVDWLETGHVDELITTLPLKKNAGPCEQVLLKASPKLAFKLIDESTEKESKSEYTSYFDENETWPNSFHCHFRENQKKPDCIELRKANEFYQNSIEKSVALIQAGIQQEHQCELRVAEFPILFQPLKKQKKYGDYADRAVAVNPNSVNNIFFYPKLILAKQEFAPFQLEVERILKTFPYDIIYANGKFVHELNGGIHCATNVAYGCSP